MSQNSHDKNKNKQDPFAWIRYAWVALATFIGGITTIVNFIQLWQGNQSTVTISFVIGGFLILITTLLYVGFKTELPQVHTWPPDVSRRVPVYPQWYKLARSLIATLVILSLIGAYSTYKRRDVLREKFIIVVANFDGPTPEKYKTTELLLSRLKQEFSSNENVLILPLNQVISELDGSQVARSLGKRYLADIVLWGWYATSTTDVIVTLHFENLIELSSEYSDVIIGNIYELHAPVYQWESFVIQSNLSTNIGYLVYLLRGLESMNNEDFYLAIKEFSDAISFYQPTTLGYFISQEMPYFMRGVSYNLLAEVDTTNNSEFYLHAINDFTFVINSPNTNPYNLMGAYYDRGLAYFGLDKWTQGRKDFLAAAQLIEPKTYDDYMLRGSAYGSAGILRDNSLVQKAIDDYTEAIRLRPDEMEAYVRRGSYLIILCDFDKGEADLFKVLDLSKDRELRFKAFRFLVSDMPGCPERAYPFNDMTPQPDDIFQAPNP